MQRTFYTFLSYIIKPYRIPLFVAAISIILIGVVPALDGILLKKLVDDLNNIHTFSDAVFYIILYTIWWELAAWVWRCYDFCILQSIPAIRTRIIDETVFYLTGQSYSYLQQNFTGALANKVADINAGIATIIEIFYEILLQKLVIVLASIVCIYAIHFYLGIVLFVWLIIFCTINLILAKYASRYAQTYAEKRSHIFGIVVDIIGNINNVRMFNGRKYERESLQNRLLKVRNAHKKTMWFQIKGNYLKGFVTSLLIGAMLAVMFYLKAEHNAITPGDFALVISIMIVLSENVWAMGHEVNTFVEQIGICTKAIQTISVPYDIVDKPNAKNLIITNGEIVFDEVSFRYSDKHLLFYNKSITIKPREKIGLVGHSGSGKSTFVNLILRLFDIESGKICIDKQNISNITLQSLHDSISYIPQEPILFNRSISDNIRYGQRTATDSEVQLAAQKAHANEFIEAIGYDSFVGERGTKLSGGQRQRIAMARAFLKNAPILIMDEATSALDSITEKKIQDSMIQLMENKTVLIIAHRLTTLLNVDKILVFHGGKIVEEGSHQKLLEKKGLYYKMWQTQNGSVILK